MHIQTPLTERSVLANGCRLITIYTPWIPRVDVEVTIDAGGGCDPRDLHGVAHALEHMVFKGPESLGAEKFARRLEETGGCMNASTGNEETSYQVSVPGPYLDLALQTLGDLVLRPALPRADWERERQVIIEEVGMRFDNPNCRLFDYAIRSYWGEHPLGQSVGGSKESLEKMQISDLRNYFETYYNPGQMLVMVASPYSHQEIRDKIENQGFGAMGRARQPMALAQATPPLVPETRHIEHDSKQLMTIFLGPGPQGVDTEDRTSLLPVHHYLASGQSSRLFLEAREKLGVAYDVSGINLTYRANGVLGAMASTTAAKLPLFEEVIRREFAAVANQGLKSEVLEGIKTRVKGQILMNAHLMDNHMRIAARKERLGGPGSMAETLALIEALTPERVAAAAYKWYQPDKLSRVTLGTGLEPEKVQAQTRGR